MKYTQFLSFEVGKECNLALKHRRCPSAHPNRWANVSTDAVLGDMTITKAVAVAYALGFRGNIAFHYYNEPMLRWGRIVELMQRIRRIHPEAKFTLWTNGTKLNDQTLGLDLLDQIWISNYEGKDWSWVHQKCHDAHVFNGELDGRLQQLRESGDPTCLRPFNELVIDYHGNGRLCCMDWRGECRLGNIITDGFLSVVQKFREIRALIADGAKASPDVCRRCVGRQQHIGNLVQSICENTVLDRELATEAQKHRSAARGAAYIGFSNTEASSLFEKSNA